VLFRSNSVLIARGVFKPTVRSRNAPSAANADATPGAAAGGGRSSGGGSARGGPRLDDQGVRDGLNNYLKPYLKA
jgi:hypothetical protein